MALPWSIILVVSPPAIIHVAGADLHANYDTYAEFSNLVKESGRDFSIVPEFNISDHIEHYSTKMSLNTIRSDDVFNVKTVKNSILDVDGRKLFLPNSVELGS